MNVMLLAIDAGNTNVVIGISDGARWLRTTRIETSPSLTAAEFSFAMVKLLDPYGCRAVRGVVIGCVVSCLKEPLMDACRAHLDCPLLDAANAVDIGIRIAYQRPSELGIDRVANVVAVRNLTDGDAVVVDLG